MKSIIVIIPYFGKLPPMFVYWKQSALNNPSVDFLLVTDNNIESNANIHVLHWTFQECRNHFQSLYDFPIALDRPYKLCDFKPAYGDIFKDYVKDYDFWGFGDLDLVYGDIRHFLTTEVLEQYWVISGWGHFTLYKNTECCNNFYKQKANGYPFYQEVFSSSKKFVFDEYLHKGMSDRWTDLFPEKVWNTNPFDDIIVPRLHFNFISFSRQNLRNLIFEYTPGKLSRVYTNNETIIKEPTLYAHFQQRKFMKCIAKNTDNYLIIPNQFIESRNYSINDLYKWGIPQNLNRVIYNLKKRILRKCHLVKIS